MFRTIFKQFFVFCFVLVFAASASAADKPNILFIFADDLAPDGVGFMGNSEVRTPHLDRLARDGCVFNYAYNQGSWTGAVCVASRTMLNTGRFLWEAVEHNEDQEREQGRMWAQYLSRAGYETYMTGKWHLKADSARTFDHTVHERPGMPNQTKEGYDRPIEGEEDPWDPSDPKFEGFWRGGKHWSEVLVDDAGAFLKQAKQSDKPFFMYLAFNAPHDPRQSPKEYVDSYPQKKVRVPENFQPIYPFAEQIGAGKRLRDEKLAPFPRTEYAIRVNRAEYYAIITHMDDQIGRILVKLEELGLRENTWIFFTADHGLGVGHHGLLGKQNMYEHSVRVPFVVVGPSVKAGTRHDARIYLQDIMPTTLELAGVDKPKHVDFRSVLPLLRGEREQQYDAIYGAYLGLQRMVIEDDYKLILYPQARVARLYNLRGDSLEMNDLADQPDSLPIMRKLFRTLQDQQKKVNDTRDLAESFPKLAGSTAASR